MARHRPRRAERPTVKLSYYFIGVAQLVLAALITLTVIILACGFAIMIINGKIL